MTREQLEYLRPILDDREYKAILQEILEEIRKNEERKGY